MANSQQFDSSELPSVGRSPRRPELTDKEIQTKIRREWGVWILNKIKVGIAQNPKTQELERVVGRQQQALDKAARQISFLEQKLVLLEDQLKHVEARNKELGHKENQILGHVASVDEKASEIDRIGRVAFGMYEVAEDLIPILKVLGVSISKRAKRLERLRAHAKSYSDGKDIDSLITQADRKRRTQFNG